MFGRKPTAVQMCWLRGELLNLRRRFCMTLAAPFCGNSFFETLWFNLPHPVDETPEASPAFLFLLLLSCNSCWSHPWCVYAFVSQVVVFGLSWTLLCLSNKAMRKKSSGIIYYMNATCNTKGNKINILRWRKFKRNKILLT